MKRIHSAEERQAFDVNSMLDFVLNLIFRRAIDTSQNLESFTSISTETCQR
jgi:hypothetical protein